MRESFLPFAPPLIGSTEISHVVETLKSDWLTTGPQAEAFERLFGEAVQAPEALALSSCTAALHLSLVALGIGPGDAVLASPLTFCSAVHVIEHVGAVPVLVDIDPQTMNIDPAGIEAVIARRDKLEGTLKAIMPVHFAGHPCDVKSIYELAEHAGLAVIEDAAHALPAAYQDRPIGSSHREGVPWTVCFSFYATKNMTTGEGGMLTSSPEVVDEARVWANHGMSRGAHRRYRSDGSWAYDVDRAGFKYNMMDIQAALGIGQLKCLPDFAARRREIAATYSEELASLDLIELPVETEGYSHAWHLYVIRLHQNKLAIDRDEFIAELRTLNIGTSVHFIPIHMLGYYENRYGYSADAYPVASREFHRAISLPIYPRMSEEDVRDVIDAVITVANKHRLQA